MSFNLRSSSLKKAGFEVARVKGSHRFLRHDDGRTTVVPVRSGEAIVPAGRSPSPRCPVVPAQAGTQCRSLESRWIPAFAGMTSVALDRRPGAGRGPICGAWNLGPGLRRGDVAGQTRKCLRGAQLAQWPIGSNSSPSLRYSRASGCQRSGSRGEGSARWASASRARMQAR